nr:hypothetical protein [Methylorubrum zatmanii]
MNTLACEFRKFASCMAVVILSNSITVAFADSEAQPPASLSSAKMIADGAERAVIGKAYDSIFSDIKNNICVELNSGVSPLGNPASTPSVDNTITQVNDSADFARKTNISTSAAFGWGSGSAEGSVSYMYSTRSSSYRSLSLLSSDVTYQPQVYDIKDFKLTTSAANLLVKSYDGFRLVCGDSFVVGFVRGGKFSAMISVDAETTEEQSLLSGSVAASSVNGNMSSDFQQLLQSKKNSGKLQISVIRDALDEPLPEFNIDSLVDYSRSYVTKVSGLSVKPVKTIKIGDYLPLIIDAAINPTGVPNVTWSQSLSGEFRYLLSLLKYKNDLDYIQQHPAQFVSFDQSLVARQVAIVNVTIDTMKAWAIQCLVSNGSNCPNPSQLHIPVPGYTPLRAGAWTVLNPAVPTPQMLGSTSAEMIVEGKGIWQFGNAPSALLPVTGSTVMIFVNKSDMNDRRRVEGVSTATVPAGFDAYFQFIDLPNSYGDNHIYAPDPASLRIGGKLDRFINGN